MALLTGWLAWHVWHVWHVKRDGGWTVEAGTQAHLLLRHRLQHHPGHHLGTDTKRPGRLTINPDQCHPARAAHRHHALQGVAARGNRGSHGQRGGSWQSAQGARQQRSIDHRRCARHGRHGRNRRTAQGLQHPIPRAQASSQPQQPRQQSRPGPAAGRSHAGDFTGKSQVSRRGDLGHRRIMIDLLHASARCSGRGGVAAWPSCAPCATLFHQSLSPVALTSRFHQPLLPAALTPPFFHTNCLRENLR